jgi:hypothetical protein
MTDAAGNFDLVTFLIWVGGIVVGAYLIHLLAVWAESRGWIYYRSSRGRGSAALSNAMSEFEAVVNPAVEHQLEEERSGQVEKDESDLPLDEEAAASPALLAGASRRRRRLARPWTTSKRVATGFSTDTYRHQPLVTTWRGGSASTSSVI